MCPYFHHCHRVFPLIGMVKQQQQHDIVLPNLIKAQMEPKHMFLADFSEVAEQVIVVPGSVVLYRAVLYLIS